MTDYKPKETLDRNVPHTDYGTTCQCGRSVLLYWNGGACGHYTCPCGRRYTMAIRTVNITVEEPKQ